MNLSTFIARLVVLVPYCVPFHARADLGRKGMVDLSKCSNQIRADPAHFSAPATSPLLAHRWCQLLLLPRWY